MGARETLKPGRLTMDCSLLGIDHVETDELYGCRNDSIGTLPVKTLFVEQIFS